MGEETSALPEESRKKILIIDGHSLAHRAYHALPVTLARPDGTPTNAVLGFCNMLVKLLEQEKPDAVVCAFDAPEPTFRHQQYEEYKATRRPMDDALRVQMPVVREAAAAFGLEVLELPGWEADDIIGSVASQAEKAGFEALIVTGDRDALQLVSDSVKVLLTKKGISEFDEFGREQVIAKYGFGPELIPDLKGLMGDASDNIPGVPGIGEKTATKLILEFGPVESIIAAAHSIKQERVRNALLEHADAARESKELATIDTNAPIDFDLDACCALRRDDSQLRAFLERQGFRSLITRLRLRKQPSDLQAGLFDSLETEAAGQVERVEAGMPAAPAGPVTVITTADQLLDLARKLAEAGRFAFHVTTSGRVTPGCEVKELVFCAGDLRACVPVRQTGAGPVQAALGSVMSDESIGKLCHDSKRQIIALRELGIDLKGVEFDSMIGGYLADVTARNAEFGDVVERWLGIGLGEGSLDTPETAAGSLGLMPQLEASVMGVLRTFGMEKLYREVELPLAGVLADMEITGVAVDTGRLNELSVEMGAALDTLAREVYEAAGEEFNLNSTRQLSVVLFEKLKLPPLKKTKTGYSTDAEVLEALAPLHPVVDKILQYRAVAKLKSTYVDALPQLVNPQTGRIHTSFNQTVAVTGRLSSADPNLQNIPVRTDEGRKIRRVFVAGGPGWVIVSADYSQIELRVLAHISGDQVLIESFRADEDIHRRTASEVFGVPFEEVTPEMRASAKAVNFGIVYGISDFGLSRNIGVSPQEAKEFIAKYFQRYKGVKNYMDSIVAQAKADGYVTTLMNRRRNLPELTSPSFQVRKFAERAAMNTPIQGTAADIMKKAMIDVHSRLSTSGLAGRLLLQVHDELVLETPADEAESLAELVRECMSGAMQLLVPLKVDVSWGPSWMDAK